MSFKELIDILKHEAKGYGGGNLVILYIIEPRFRVNALFRMGQFLYKNNCCKVLRWFIRIKLWLKYSFEVYFNVEIDKGLKIVHLGRIVIHSNCKIGKNCKILNDVNIGSDGKGEPVIGDNVFIGAGAKIIGQTKIGNNCKVGANAVVKGEFEDNCIIAGVPAKKIKSI